MHQGRPGCVITAAFCAAAIRFTAAHKEREQALYDEAVRERELDGGASALLVPETTGGAP